LLKIKRKFPTKAKVGFIRYSVISALLSLGCESEKRDKMVFERCNK
jgi:hypothetical protein